LRFTSLLPRLWANWITLLGSVISTISGFAILLLLVIGLAAPSANPYQSLLVVVALPIAFAIGLLLIPLGLYFDRRRAHEGPKDALQAAFEAAFNDRSARRRIIFVAVATLANIGLFAFAGQKTIAHMDSPAFCGTACHQAMQPEWEAWNRSPHSNVACVDCHIAPGAAGEIKAKWNGVHQLVGVLTSYDRPVVAQVGELPTARESCEHCHSPQRFKPDQIKLFAHYDLDTGNTPKFNAMLVRIGGFNRLTQQYQGIHWHANPDNQVKFEYLDPERAKVGKVTVVAKGQTVAEYLPSGAPQKALGVRTMDCMDCHNRPAHVFDGTPKNAIDRALFIGALDPKIPLIAEVSVALLSQTTVPRDQAEAHFKTAIAAAYQGSHPEVKADPAALDKAAKTLAMLYLRNVYPELKLGWNRHRSNLGHKVEGVPNAGCFRCHDSDHQATLADGRKKKLGQDCDTCHTGLVFDEDPAKFDDTLSAMMPAAD